MLRVIDRTHRPPVIIVHRGRPATEKEREDPTMESYRIQIIAMLDNVTDAKLMRELYEDFKAKMENRKEE